MTKLNNLNILLAIVFLIVFVVFLSVGISFASQKYFVNMEYVSGTISDNEYYTYQTTYAFDEYGHVRMTVQYSTHPEKAIQYSTYIFHEQLMYSESKDPSSFEIDGYRNALVCRNAFQLEHGDYVFTNYKAIGLLAFYCIMSFVSLVLAIVLLLTHKKGMAVFGRVKKLKQQLDELQKQIDKLKKGE